MENSSTEIGYHESNLISIESENQIFVAVKPIIKGVGLKWKIYKKEFRSLDYNCIKREINNQKFTMISLANLDSWLHTLKVNKANRKNLDFYLKNTYQILQQYWIKKKHNPCNCCPFGNIKDGIPNERGIIRVNKGNLESLLRSVDILCHWYDQYAATASKEKIGGFIRTCKLGMTLLSTEIDRTLLPHDILNNCSWQDALNKIQFIHDNDPKSSLNH